MKSKATTRGSDFRYAKWRTASYSVGNGECVEVALVNSSVAIRDSKNRGGAVLLYTYAQWQSFLVTHKI